MVLLQLLQHINILIFKKLYRNKFENKVFLYMARY